MTKASISLQDLRRRIYLKAKAEPTKRFWGVYVHVCKLETLYEAYAMARANNGAPGIDGVTFKVIEESGVGEFLEQIRAELLKRSYRPNRVRKKEIPKEGGKVRTLSIPTIRDRVVQGAMKLILEPIFEADFQPGSFGYRPKRTAQQAVDLVGKELVYGKTRVIDVDLRAYFDNVRHHILLKKVAERVSDPDVLRLLKLILKTTGKKGVPQGGVLSPLLSNVYLNEVDGMLEKAKQVTRQKQTRVEYVRYADDLVVLVDQDRRRDWLLKAVQRRLREELQKIQVDLNEEKSRVVDLREGQSFGFLGFTFRLARSYKGKVYPLCVPKTKKRTALLRRLKVIFRHMDSQPLKDVVGAINPILRGWVNYFRIGHSDRCFKSLRHWVEMKLYKHQIRAKGHYGGRRMARSRFSLYRELGLFSEYRLAWRLAPKATS